MEKIKTVSFEVGGDGKLICPDCGKSFTSKGASCHWRIVHRGDRSGGGWNKGKNKEQSESLRVAAEKCSRVMKEKMKALTPEHRKQKFGGIKAYSPFNGGIRRGAGRGKKGWYCGIWCDSTWELAWVIYQIEAGISFARNTDAFYYEFEGKKWRFFPDFRLSDGLLVEIKGWVDKRNRAKIASVDGLLVIGKEEIKPYLDCAKRKYGEDFSAIAYGVASEPSKRGRGICIDCGTDVLKESKRCKRCAGIDNTTQKIAWPSCDAIKAMVKDNSWEAVARNLSVSSNAVRKHLKIYERFGKLAEMV